MEKLSYYCRIFFLWQDWGLLLFWWSFNLLGHCTFLVFYFCDNSFLPRFLMQAKAVIVTSFRWIVEVPFHQVFWLDLFWQILRAFTSHLIIFIRMFPAYSYSKLPNFVCWCVHPSHSILCKRIFMTGFFSDLISFPPSFKRAFVDFKINFDFFTKKTNVILQSPVHWIFIIFFK